MARRGTTDRGGDRGDVLDLLVETIADRVAEKLRAASLGAAPSEFVDQTNAPIPRRTYLKAARAGAFPSSEIDRRIVARRADVLRWIESRRRLPKAEPVSDHSALDDEVSRRLTAMGLRRVG